jgi:hypothetical protein
VTDKESLEDLRRRFPLCQIWYVARVTEKGAVWCANPWAKRDDRRDVLHADKPEHLAEYITEAQAGRRAPARL